MTTNNVIPVVTAMTVVNNKKKHQSSVCKDKIQVSGQDKRMDGTKTHMNKGRKKVRRKKVRRKSKVERKTKGMEK